MSLAGQTGKVGGMVAAYPCFQRLRRASTDQTAPQCESERMRSTCEAMTVYLVIVPTASRRLK